MSVGPLPDDHIFLQTKKGSSKGKKTAHWREVTKNLKKRGVVKVEPDHHHYHLLDCVRHGLRDLLKNHPEQGPKTELSPADYKSVRTTTLKSEIDGKQFHFTSYASSVFATIRHAAGLTEEEFAASVAGDESYLEFLSSSRGGQHFYLSNDKAYFMKTEKKYYFNIFRSILSTYMEHLIQFPHSLLVKYLGLFSIKLHGQKELYFYVMQSILYPSERIEFCFDLKGCLAGRYEKEFEPGQEVLAVYKDQNFLGKSIKLGSQRDWFLRQLRHDVDFLQKLRVQDYSLVLGLQNIHQDEREQDFGDVVTRVQRSLANVEVSPIRTQSERGGLEHAIPENDTSEMETSLQQTNSASDRYATTNGQTSVLTSTRRPRVKRRPLSFIVPDPFADIGAKNLRMLPKCKNPLHIIDGPDTRYYVGIIDFFTLFECRQRMGEVLKDIKYRCGDHSTLPPPAYATRFFNFISDHTA